MSRRANLLRTALAATLLITIVATTQSVGLEASVAGVNSHVVRSGVVHSDVVHSDVGTTYYPVSGVGSTWSAIALQQWRTNVNNNFHWVINYTDAGSSAGRQQFGLPGGGGTDFAVSEIPYALANSDSKDPAPSRHFAYMPIVAGGTSFMYNLVIAGKRVTNLRLAGPTLSKIFTGAITKWNDPAIVADNPALALPALSIIPVVRSDGSGTSAQFSAWMRTEYPDIWNTFCQKVGRVANCGITSNYPAPSGSAFVAQSGSDGVSGYVTQSQYVGSIGYVEYAYALNASFPVVKLLNTAGYYTEPTAGNVAVALLAAQIDNNPASPSYLTQQLGSVYTNNDPRTYPLSSYSYMIIPTALEDGFTENKGLTLAAFANYFLCQGQQQAQVMGYSPLPLNLVKAGLSQVLKIPGGDNTKVNINNCNNPTFAADGSNRLATTAAQPQACDKQGALQCLTGTGGAKAATVATSSGGSAAARGGSTTGDAAGTAATTADGSTTAAGADPASAGLAAADGAALAASTISGVPTIISAVPPTLWYMTFAVLALAALAFSAIFVPSAVARRRQRRRQSPRANPTTPRTLLPRIPLPFAAARHIARSIKYGSTRGEK